MLINGSNGNDDAERASLAFIVGNTALASDHEAVVFLTAEGVRVATRGYADNVQAPDVAPLQDLVAEFLKSGGTLLACAACCKPRGISETDLIDGAEIAGAARFVELMADGYATFSP